MTTPTAPTGSLPFQTATSTDGPVTHLVLHSPQLADHAPTDLAPRTLCGRATATPSVISLGDVECILCLLMSPTYMMWPTFESTK